MKSHSNLFVEGRIGPLAAKNRIAMSAVHLGLAENGNPSRALLNFYEQRARGGAGVITVGVCNTWKRGEALLKNALDFCADDAIAAMSDLADRVKRHGALIGAQLSPLIGYNNPKWHPDLDTLPEIIESLGQAANRAKKSGFDFVELLMSGGSLFSHFLSPEHNQWQIPGYFGGWDERLRAPLEALASIRDAVGAEFPVLARIHCHEFLDKGYDLEGARTIAEALCRAGVAALNITGGGHRTRLPQLTSHTPPLAFVSMALKIRGSLEVPVISGGRIHSPREAEAARAMGVDFVAMARALITDPDWPNKVRELRPIEILPCMACCSCLDQAVSGEPVRCSLNPQTGRAGAKPESNRKKEKIGEALVAGSGPAGLQAAWSLSEAGYHVTVREKSDRLGGRWSLAAKLRGRQELAAPLEVFVARLKSAGVSLETGVEVTPESVRDFGPDLLVVATGAHPRRPDIPGLSSHSNVLDVEQAIERPDAVGSEVVVIGAGGVGLELAVHFAAKGEPGLEILGFLARYGEPAWLAQALSVRPGARVTLLRRCGYPGKGMGRSVRWTLMRDLERLNVRVVDRARYEEVLPDGVRIFDEKTENRELIRADTIIIAAGYEPDHHLIERLNGIAPKTVVVGDAVEVTNIGKAIAMAYDAVISL